jgi:cob(I)alamin adenosyltransferase
MKGRVVIHTGNGKGKTTAALGTVFRALGHGQKVCVIQFIKGKGKYGERVMAEAIENLDWFVCGKGLLFRKDNLDSDREVALEGIKLAANMINSGEYDLVVLDEITYLSAYDFVPVDSLAELIAQRPEHVSLILTGRRADQILIDLADTVSSVTEVKHALREGVRAQKGIEY